MSDVKHNTGKIKLLRPYVKSIFKNWAQEKKSQADLLLYSLKAIFK